MGRHLRRWRLRRWQRNRAHLHPRQRGTVRFGGRGGRHGRCCTRAALLRRGLHVRLARHVLGGTELRRRMPRGPGVRCLINAQLHIRLLPVPRADGLPAVLHLCRPVRRWPRLRVSLRTAVEQLSVLYSSKAVWQQQRVDMPQRHSVLLHQPGLPGGVCVRQRLYAYHRRQQQRAGRHLRRQRAAEFLLRPEQRFPLATRHRVGMSALPSGRPGLRGDAQRQLLLWRRPVRSLSAGHRVRFAGKRRAAVWWLIRRWRRDMHPVRVIASLLQLQLQPGLVRVLRWRLRRRVLPRILG